MAKALNARPPVHGDTIAGMLDADGALTPEGEQAANVSDETLRDLYRWMVICRRFDQEGLNFQRQGELGLWGPFAGHEADQVGAAMAMASTDWIFPYYRDFGMAICRGIDPGKIMTIFRGITHGAWNPNEYRFAPVHHSGWLAGATCRRLRNGLQARPRADRRTRRLWRGCYLHGRLA